MTFKRLDSGGHIDRNTTITFKYRGLKRKGFAGDTLASALLANNFSTIGRSFKYHRPRGIMAAGVEEPNALFTINGVPNVSAPITELVAGMKVKSQNAFPSPAFDFGAVNSWFASLLGAGFYYKTFMGPRQKSWMFYERFIRKAAGLGKGNYDTDAARYDTRHEFCDCLVVGSGPAGLSAATMLARAGLRVTLAEQDFLLGGQILSCADQRLDDWRKERIAELEAASNLRILKRATVQGIYDGNQAIIAQRYAGGMVLESLRFDHVIFATGASERPLIFENNDRPGIMLASALRTYLNRFALSPVEDVVITTNNDSAYDVGSDLAPHVGVTIVDQRSDIAGDVLARAAAAGIVVYPGSGIAQVEGAQRLEAVTLFGRHPRVINTQLLGMSGGWNPLVHLTSHSGVKPVYNAKIESFLPGDLPKSHCIAGAIAGDFATLRAIRSGEQQAKSVIEACGLFKKFADVALPQIGIDRTYTIKSFAPESKGAKAFVDFQGDVTLKDIKTSHQEGYSNVEHLKRYTTLGMGTDQGKTSNVHALQLMAGLRDKSVSELGTTTFRPPFTPLTVGAIAGRSVGKHFRPIRRSPLHYWNEKNGATFIEAGLWKRAWYYDWAGKTPETAYLKEMELVRHNVGLADVSTLGKIDVQGKDAAEFLDRVYVNGFAKLEKGRARYGVMLNDDGIVLDDGTTSRIKATQYYMTTTTAMAGEVMSWLEYLLQCHWTDLDVHVTSLTDEWGGMALSGPNARKALELAFPDVNVSNEKLPYMAVKDVEFEGVPVRLLRLSFSGELGYEIHCPANYTQSLWEHVLKAGAPLGLKPYGLEALASLRIEKGHVAGLELDHRNTLDDLGLGKLASKTKPYIGQVLRERENLKAPERWSLVGFELLEPEKKLRGGSILFAANDEIKGHGRGYITSVTWSTDLNCFIALGLYEGGLKHEYEEVIAAFPLKNETARLRIVSPHFIDSQGTRLNA